MGAIAPANPCPSAEISLLPVIRAQALPTPTPSAPVPQPLTKRSQSSQKGNGGQRGLDHWPAAGISYLGCPKQRCELYRVTPLEWRRIPPRPCRPSGILRDSVAMVFPASLSTAKRRCCPPISSTPCTRSSSVVGTEISQKYPH